MWRSSETNSVGAVGCKGVLVIGEMEIPALLEATADVLSGSFRQKPP